MFLGSWRSSSPTRLTRTSKTAVSALAAVLGAVLSSSTGLGTQTGRRLASFTSDQLDGSPDCFCSNWVKGLKRLRAILEWLTFHLEVQANSLKVKGP